MSSSDRKRPRIFYGWWIVIALFISNFAVEVTAIFSFAVFLKPMSEALGISRAGMGWVVGARRLAHAGSSVLAGRLIDRYGSRILIPIAAGIAGFAMMAISLVQGFWPLLILFTIIGLSGIAMPGNLLTSVPIQNWFSRKRGRATAYAASGFGIGGMVFALLHQSMIDSIGWRLTWVWSGIFLIVLLVPLALLVIRRSPEDMGLQPDGEPSAQAGDAITSAASSGERSWTVSEAFRTLSLWKITGAYLLLSFAMGGLQVHRVAFWEDRGYGRSLIATSYSVDALVFFAGILVAGFLVERLAVRHVAAVAIASTMTGVATMILFDATWALFGSALLMGVGQGTTSVVQVHIWPSYFGRTYIGAIRGYIIPGIVIGQAAGAPFAGFIFDTGGSYIPAFWTSFVCLMMAIVFLGSAKPPVFNEATLLK
jgi:sugar phosphate permease